MLKCNNTYRLHIELSPGIQGWHKIKNLLAETSVKIVGQKP